MSGRAWRRRGVSSLPDVFDLSLRRWRSNEAIAIQGLDNRVGDCFASLAMRSINRIVGGSPWIFKGKVALITGAGNGIGRAAALGFPRDGAKVVVVDRDTAGGEGTAGIIRQQGGEALFVAADVTKSADVQAYVKAALDWLRLRSIASTTTRASRAMSRQPRNTTRRCSMR